MKTFNILKKNRKYFAARVAPGDHKCKILIDENSDALELGESTLEVDDISVRSKYGTDLIFRLSASVDKQKDAGICTLRADYNEQLVAECRRLGGKWDPEEKAWIFSGLVESEVEELDLRYNSKKVAVKIHFSEEESAGTGPVTVAGIPIASASGRDSGAKLRDGIAVLSGGASSGGSRKNWYTIIEAGTTLRMYMPEALIKEEIDGVTIERIETKKGE